MKTIIVAYDRLRTIGKDGDIPWRGTLPVDMEFFRASTVHQPVVMGRKTYESIPERFRPLPERMNIVMSLSARAIEWATVARSLDEAYGLAGGNPTIIGGSDVYSQALPTVDRILATEIDTETAGGDAFFPELPDNMWKETARRPFEANVNNAYNGAFVLYMRRGFIQQPLRREK